MPLRFTAGAQKVVVIAQEEAKKLNHDYVGTEHLLLGLAYAEGEFSAKVLQALGVSGARIKREIEQIVGVGDSLVMLAEVPFTPRAKKVLEHSFEEAQMMGHPFVGTEHLLLGITGEDEGVAAKILADLGLTRDIIRAIVIKALSEDLPPFTGREEEQAEAGPLAAPGGTAGARAATAAKPKSKTPTLDEHSRDLTLLARENKLDPVIGRETEIERLTQILARRTKNNPVLIGEPGVGKTAIVEGLAQRMAAGEIADVLHNKRLVSIDLGSLVAGTKYRGEFEQRLKNIIEEIEKSRDIILFIDEFHTIVGAGAAEGSMDASNMLKPALARGEMQCIGATTFDEYRKYVEADPALERRFQPITAEPSTVEETIEILKGLKTRYEEHHKVKFSDCAIEAAAAIADRYITDRAMPDKAIDLLDEAGSRARLKNSLLPPEIKEKEQALAKLVKEKDAAIAKQQYEEAAKLRDEEEKAAEEIKKIREDWQARRSENQTTVTEEDIAVVASKWTGIPVTRLTQSETDKILKMEAYLHERIIGQDEGVRAISQAIRRSRTGLGNPKRPIGGFLFLGPTGVGKTELAKTLATFLFGDEDAMIRMDMSEYMEKFAVSRLIGAPPGYVGYEEGGQLTEAVRRRPYSVVVLDEFEKAHPDIYNILLQVLDEGTLSDNLGHKVNFRNTVIIMTSNVGAREITNKGSRLGFTPSTDETRDYGDMKQNVMEEVRKTFNPEFINRIDELIVFHSLNKEHMLKILELNLKDIQEKLEAQNLKIKFSEEAKSFLVENGFDPKYGARPLLRTLQRELEDPLAEFILQNQYPSKTEIKVNFDEEKNKIFFSASKPRVGKKCNL
jgi:ATP-dependent Clp protease ATP-binding subunit ClpC